MTGKNPNQEASSVSEEIKPARRKLVICDKCALVQAFKEACSRCGNGSFLELDNSTKIKKPKGAREV